MDYKNWCELYDTFMGDVGKMGKEIGAIPGFAAMHQWSAKDGALSGKHKELIALGIGIAVRCDGCIACHVNDALKAGASPEEIKETIGVAILMGGGPAVVYGAHAYEALKQFEEAGA